MCTTACTYIVTVVSCGCYNREVGAASIHAIARGTVKQANRNAHQVQGLSDECHCQRDSEAGQQGCLPGPGGYKGRQLLRWDSCAPPRPGSAPGCCPPGTSLQPAALRRDTSSAPSAPPSCDTLSCSRSGSQQLSQLFRHASKQALTHPPPHPLTHSLAHSLTHSLAGPPHGPPHPTLPPLTQKWTGIVFISNQLPHK